MLNNLKKYPPKVVQFELKQIVKWYNSNQNFLPKWYSSS